MANNADTPEINPPDPDEKRQHEADQRQHEIELEKIRARTRSTLGLIALIAIVFAAVVPVITVTSGEKQSLLGVVGSRLLEGKAPTATAIVVTATFVPLPTSTPVIITATFAPRPTATENTELRDTITRTNGILDALQGLIEGDAVVTPIPDPSVDFPTPVIDYVRQGDVWALQQNSADPADGLYKGQFMLALETGCSTLTLLSQNVVMPADGVPARWQAPPPANGSAPRFVDLASMDALNEKQVGKFTIRSSAPFEVQINLKQCTKH